MSDRRLINQKGQERALGGWKGKKKKRRKKWGGKKKEKRERANEIAQARACAGTTGLPQRAKKPVTSEHHNRSQITDHRNVEKMGN